MEGEGAERERQQAAPAGGPSAGAPALNQVSISARSSSVMPVELLIGITRDTTTCW